MEKDVLNKYLLNLLESIERNLTTYIKLKEPECLHNLRVDIKKINALFSFAEKIYNKKYSAILLRPLFIKAGKIREIQINLSLLSEISNRPEKLISGLRKKENILIQQFIKMGSQYAALVKRFRKKTSLPELLPGKVIVKKYFKKEKSKAVKLLKNIDRENLHGFRKKIKKIIYIHNALPRRMQKNIEIDFAVINKQQKWVGDWHDIYSAIKFLSIGFSPPKKSNYILNLKAKEKTHFNNLLLKLTNKVK